MAEVLLNLGLGAEQSPGRTGNSMEEKVERSLTG